MDAEEQLAKLEARNEAREIAEYNRRMLELREREVDASERQAAALEKLVVYAEYWWGSR